MIQPLLSIMSLVTLLALLPQNSRADYPALGCGSSRFSSGIYTMEHRELTRTFRVHVPTGYNEITPMPLVLMFHGWDGDENAFIGNRAVIAEADKRGYILAAPRGLGSGPPDNSFNSWSFSGSTTGLDGNSKPVCDTAITPDYSYKSCESVKKNSCSWTQCQADDIDFVIALVDEIKENLCVDAENVFATGGSNGGMFTWELGQNPKSASTFAAIAPVIGLPHRTYLDAQGKNGDLPVIVITGTLDDVVPPGPWDDDSFTTTSNANDRFYYTGASAITRSWAAAHGCDTWKEAVPIEVAYKAADCRTWCSTDRNMPRVLDCRATLGHSYGLPWSWKLTMDFFDAHKKRAAH